MGLFKYDFLGEKVDLWAVIYGSLVDLCQSISSYQSRFKLIEDIK